MPLDIFTSSGPLGLTLATGHEPDRFARNGELTDGVRMAQLAGRINTYTSRRLHVLAEGGVYASDTLGVEPAKARFHTSLNPLAVEVQMICGPGLSSSAHGAIQWTVGGVAQSVIKSSNVGSSSSPTGFQFLKQRFVDGSGNALAGDTVFDCSVSPTNTAILSWIIYEVPLASIGQSAAVQATLGYDVFGVGNPILDRDWAQLTNAMWELYKHQGPSVFNWARPSVAGSSGTTWRNIIDLSTTGWAANAAGWPSIAYRKNRLTGSVVNVKLWARAQTDTGSGGRVRFSDSSGVVGTITGFGTTESTIAIDATLSATPTSDLLVVEHSDSLGNIVNTFAAGAYEYLA